VGRSRGGFSGEAIHVGGIIEHGRPWPKWVKKQAWIQYEVLKVLETDIGMKPAGTPLSVERRR